MINSIFKTIYTIIFIVTIITNSYAQQQLSISGHLKTNDGQPLSYATLSLLNGSDSSIVKRTISDSVGTYHFVHTSAGTYLVKATAIGYRTAVSRLFSVSTGSSGVTLPVITLLPASNALSSVTITASKPLIEHASDKVIINVANSALATGNSALDILKRAPGVSVDKDDNISLKGKQGVMVMIDDKPTYLSTAELATLLRSTDGSTIQAIELINNPSAKYDAAGSSGIINIKLKKNKRNGTNGTLLLGAGYGKYYKDNEAISLNHKQGDLNIFGSFNRHDDHTAQNIDIDKIIPGDNGGNTYFKEHTFIIGTGYNNSYRGGADYNTSANNVLGFLVSGYFNSEVDANNDHTAIGTQPNVTDSYQNTLSPIDQHYHNFAVNLNDKWSIDTIGKQLSIDLDYSKFNNSAQMQHSTYFYNADGTVQMPPAFLRTQTPSTIIVRTAKADYTWPVNKLLKLEAGVKYSDVNTDNTLNAQTMANSQYVNDTLLTNHFKYDERIGASYVTVNKSFKTFTVQAGLRTEYTSSTGVLEQAANHEVKRDYLDFFPSVFINKQVDDKDELGISYSRRIDRPGYDNLNPFIYYLNQYTYQVGNPFLNPQYTNKFELSYNRNKMLNFSFGFSHTSAVITELFVTKGDTSIDETLNFNSQNVYDVDVNLPYDVAGWWSGNIDLTGFYTQVKSDTLLGSQFNKGKIAFQFKTNQTFKLTKRFKAELATVYWSSSIMGIYTMKPYYGVDAAVSGLFAAEKLNVKLGLNDLFNTYSMIATTNYQTDNIYFKQKGETRVLRLMLLYNFGSSHLKTREHSSGAADENGRVKGNN